MTDEIKTEKTVAETPATELTAEVTVPTKTEELVMEAKVSNKKTKKGEKNQKPEKTKQENEKTFKASTCVITNTSMNNICLFDGDKFQSITVRPREILTVEREALKRLLKNEMVQRFFDKGILTHNLEADGVSAHDAVAPEELKNPVERHEDGQNVKAEVKTYRKEGTISLDLG